MKKQNTNSQNSPQYRAANRNMNQIMGLASDQSASQQSLQGQLRNDLSNLPSEMNRPSLRRTPRAIFRGFNFTGGQQDQTERQAQIQQIATQAALQSASNRVRTAGASERDTRVGASDNSYFNPTRALGARPMGSLGTNPRIAQNTLQHPDGTRYALDPSNPDTQEVVNPFNSVNAEISVDEVPQGEGENPADYMQNPQTMTRPFSRARQVHPPVNPNQGGLPAEVGPSRPALKGFQRTSGAPILDPAAGLVSTQAPARGLGVGGQSNDTQIQHGSEVGYDEVADTMEPTTGGYTTPVPPKVSEREPDNYVSRDTSLPTGAVRGVAPVGSSIGRGAGSYTTPLPEPTYTKPQEEYVSTDTTPPAGSIGSVSARGGFKGSSYASSVQQAAQEFLRGQQERLGRDPIGTSSDTNLNYVPQASAERASTVSNTVVNPYSQEYNQSLAARGMTGNEPSAYDYVNYFKQNKQAPQERVASSDSSLNYVPQTGNRPASRLSNTVVDYSGTGVGASRPDSRVSNTVVDYRGTGVGGAARGLKGASHSYAPDYLQVDSGSDTSSDSGLSYSSISSANGGSMSSVYSDNPDEHDLQTSSLRQFRGNLANTPENMEDYVNDAIETGVKKSSQLSANVVSQRPSLYQSNGDMLSITPEGNKAIGGIKKAGAPSLYPTHYAPQQSVSSQMKPVNGDYLNTPSMEQRTARGIQSSEAAKAQYPTHYQVPTRSGTGLGLPQDTQVDYVSQGQKAARGINPSGLKMDSVPPTHYEIPARSGEGLSFSKDTSLGYTPVAQSATRNMSSAPTPQGKYATHYEIETKANPAMRPSKDANLDYVSRTPAKSISINPAGTPKGRAPLEYTPVEQQKAYSLGDNLGPASNSEVSFVPTQQVQTASRLPVGSQAINRSASFTPAQDHLTKTGIGGRIGRSPAMTPEETATPIRTISMAEYQASKNKRPPISNRSSLLFGTPNRRGPKESSYVEPKLPGSYRSADVDNYENEGMQGQGFDPASVERGRKMLVKGKTMGQVRDQLGYESRRDFLGRQHDKKINMLRVGDVLNQNDISHGDVHQYLQYVNSQNGGDVSQEGSRMGSLPHLVSPSGIKGASHIITRIMPKFR